MVRFKRSLYLITGLSMIIAYFMVAWTFSEDLGKAFASPSESESTLWIAGAALLALILIGLGSFYIVSWKHNRIEKNYMKRKVMALLFLILFLPLAIGLPVVNILNYIPPDRGPYLSWTRGPQTSMTITWESKRDNLDVFRWGSDKDSLSNTLKAMKTGPRSDDGYFHYTVTITGLTPDTEYWYGIDGFTKSAMNFRTAPADSSKPFKFIVYGDSRERQRLFDNQHIPLVKEMLELAGDNPLEYALVINTGDIAYDYDYVHGWNAHFYAIRDLASHVPYMVASGNHEWWTDAEHNWDPNQPANWIQEFPTKDFDNESIGGLDEISFAFGYGCVYFINIGYPHAGANLTENPELRTWIEKQLTIGNTSYMFTIVSFHRPPFDDRPGTDHDDNPDIIRNLCPLLHLGDVDVVLNGHDHVLARHNITWVYDDDNQTITYLTTGGGGASLRGYDKGVWDNKYGMGFKGCLVSSDDVVSTYHFYMVEVDPASRSLHFTAYDLEGNVVDEFTQYAINK